MLPYLAHLLLLLIVNNIYINTVVVLGARFLYMDKTKLKSIGGRGRLYKKTDSAAVRWRSFISKRDMMVMIYGYIRMYAGEGGVSTMARRGEACLSHLHLCRLVVNTIIFIITICEAQQLDGCCRARNEMKEKKRRGSNRCIYMCVCVWRRTRHRLCILFCKTVVWHIKVSLSSLGGNAAHFFFFFLNANTTDTSVGLYFGSAIRLQESWSNLCRPFFFSS